MAVRFNQKGDFKRTEKFLETMRKQQIFDALETYARQGVNALASATPVDSGLTAASWGYVVDDSQGQYSITWTNSHENKGVNIAIILQYGHGTGTGGYVQGLDYINPAIMPVFERISKQVWKEVTSA